MTYNIPTKKLIEAVKVLSKKFDDESMVAFELALNILENRISEAEFTQLCEELQKMTYEAIQEARRFPSVWFVVRLR